MAFVGELDPRAPNPILGDEVVISPTDESQAYKANLQAVLGTTQGICVLKGNTTAQLALTIDTWIVVSKSDVFAVDSDVDAWWDGATGRITVPRAGLYRATANVEVRGVASGTSYSLRWIPNGVSANGKTVARDRRDAIAWLNFGGSAIFNLSANDYLDLSVFFSGSASSPYVANSAPANNISVEFLARVPT